MSTEPRVPKETIAARAASAAAAEAGLLFQMAGSYSGSHLELDGVRLANFAGLSYLGLDAREELREGAIEATRRYGTAFPFPRAMLEAPLCAELEALLARMTGGHAVVAASTTLVHLAALPELVEPGDAVVLDRGAHPSLHTALALVENAPVGRVPCDRLDLLELELEKLAAKHRRIWYVLDGLSPGSGRLAPFAALSALFARYPALWLYVDEAHSTSWAGTHGRGHALDAFADRSRLVVTLSLNKAFAAAGGALIVPNEELRTRVLRSRGLSFSGALQPPMLGAAVASARLHLEGEFAGLQHALAHRVGLVLELAERLGVPLLDRSFTPLFFVRCGSTERTFALVHALRRRGSLVCGVVFPIVPAENAGIRFTVSLHNELADVACFMAALAEEVATLK